MKTTNAKVQMISTAHARFPAPALVRSRISAISHEGLSITDAEGRPARLAILDGAGNVLDVGQPVADACWRVAITSYYNLLKDKGYIRVMSAPTQQLVGTK